jgi:stage V sporulation protein B
MASAAMGLSAWLVYFGLSSAMGVVSRSHYVVAMMAAVLVGVVVYAVAAIKLKAITAEDMKLIPKGEKISKLLHLR